MAAKSLIISLFLILSSHVMGDPAGSLPCLNKILPCKQFLQDPSAKPDQSCCLPLKQLIVNDIKCLCDVLSDPTLLKTANITKDEALKLPKACGSNADDSLCNALPPSSSSGSTSPSPPAEKTPSTKSAAHGKSEAGVSGIVALLIAFIFYQSTA